MFVLILSLLPFSIGAGSKRASIQWRMVYSSANVRAVVDQVSLGKVRGVVIDKPSSGAIQTLPAISSEPEDGKVFWYLRSASSSNNEAQGNAALNMPVALT